MDDGYYYSGVRKNDTRKPETIMKAFLTLTTLVLLNVLSIALTVYCGSLTAMPVVGLIIFVIVADLADLASSK